MGRIARASATGAAVGLAAMLGCSQTSATVNTALANDEATESYSLGVAVARQATAGLEDIDEDAFMAGFSDTMRGQDLALSSEDMMAALDRYEARRIDEAKQQLAELAAANREQGDAFRADFAKDPEVVTTESGLQYKVLAAGEGEVPAEGDTVTLHYRGTLVDGSEIDSTWSRNAPVTLPVGAGLPGWTEALSLMPAGSKWQVVLPPELAFGDSGAAPIVQPGATVVFELELVAVG